MCSVGSLRGSCHLCIQGRRINQAGNHVLYSDFQLGVFFDLKIEATCCPETSVDIQQTTNYIHEDIILYKI
jgi:hypothetical protein